MVGIAGLAEKVITTGSRVPDPGFFRLSGQKHVFRCWNKRGHGSVDLKVAITQSCDTFFYDLAYRMGIDRFSTFMRTFGFGERTGIDLPSEATGLMPSQEWKQRRHKSSWYPETRLISVSGRVIGYLHRCNWRTRQRLWRITVNA
ncbi:penicillin-binding transpeptidase domain-containing protein [Candidatus Thiothrix anitrata]|uniref:penicillin-binding transpeptidase domain-containing protein n=1 Tax=Candidatus Thiothrix anitrata TaxID=2823902 RepID=UPI00224BA615|nr:penicillin-binding transpeptidase domain-containing protein [Candidatus Thiothrix anitrata]